MKLQVELSKRTIIRFWLAPLVIVAVLAAIYWTRQALILIALSIFLAVAISPLVQKISDKFFNGKRVLATSVAYLGLVLVIVGMMVILVPAMIQQTNEFSQTAPKMISRSIASFRKNELVKRFGLEQQLTDTISSLDSNRDAIATNLVTRINSAFSSIISFVIIVVLSFLMVIDGPSIMASFWSFYDHKDMMKQHKRLAGKFYTIITTFVSGQLTVALINAILASIVVLILSMIFPVPANLMAPIGVTVGLIGLVPMVGATIGAIIAAILLSLSSIPAGISFIIYYTIYQQVENNLIIPYVQSRSLELSPLIVLISVTVGLYLFGLLGGIISIPFAACLKAIFEENFSTEAI